MIDLPTKPRITVETRRDPYAITFLLHLRKPWTTLSPEARITALQQGAEALDELAQQMRDEAKQLQGLA